MKKGTIWLAVTVVALSVAPAFAQNAPAAAAAPAPAPAPSADKPQWTDVQTYSYAVGIQIGKGIKNQIKEFDLDTFNEGLKDALNDKPLRLTQEEMKQAVMNMQMKQQEERKQKAEANLAEQKAWMEENGKKEGVVTLPSGLQYKILTEGTGPSPTLTDRIKINYRGTFPNGEEFDSSAKRGVPIELQVNKTIPAWKEALPLMKVGSKWELYVPSELAYGTMGQGNRILPNQMLIFEVELLEILPQAPPSETVIPNTPPPAAAPAAPPATPSEAAAGSS